MQRILDISVPIRKGNRGGHDQFSWEDVKADKYKECYLGYSLNTARPTFNMPRPNAGWYAKKEESGPVDLAAIKAEEEQLMAEALGLAPRRNHLQQKPLDKADLDNLTKRGATERGIYDDGERVEGVGFRPSYSHETVGGVITSVETKLEGKDEAGWLEKGIQATPARAEPSERSARPSSAATNDDWVERKPVEQRERKDKSDKKRKEKKETQDKKDKHHKKDKHSHSSSSHRRRASPERDAASSKPRRRTPSPPSPRRRIVTPPDARVRRRTPSPDDRPIKRRSPLPDARVRRRTPSPDARVRRRSPSPDRVRRRSRSPLPIIHRRSRSPERNRTAASASSGHSRRRSRSPEPRSRRV